MLDWLLGTRQEPSPDTVTGPFALIEWDEVAKKFCVGGDEVKVIRVYDENGEIIGEYLFSRARIKFLEDRGIPVINMTAGMDMPEECVSDIDEINPIGAIWQ